MKRQELDLFLGKVVKLTMFDNDVIEGTLYRTTDKKFKGMLGINKLKNYYVLEHSDNSLSYIFRISYIKRLIEV